jgi:hypothetical protein
LRIKFSIQKSFWVQKFYLTMKHVSIWSATLMYLTLSNNISLINVSISLPQHAPVTLSKTNIIINKYRMLTWTTQCAVTRFWCVRFVVKKLLSAMIKIAFDIRIRNCGKHFIIKLKIINHDFVLTPSTWNVGWYVNRITPTSPTTREMMYADTPNMTKSITIFVTLAGIAISFRGLVWVSFSAIFSTLMHFN